MKLFRIFRFLDIKWVANMANVLYPAILCSAEASERLAQLTLKNMVLLKSSFLEPEINRTIPLLNDLKLKVDPLTVKTEALEFDAASLKG